MTVDDALTLPDLADALVDAAGLLDMIVEHVATHRRTAGAVDDAARVLDLHTIEDTAARAWAAAQEARTALTALLTKEHAS